MSDTKSYVNIVIKKSVTGSTGFEATLQLCEGTTEEMMNKLIDTANNCKDYLIDNVKL